MTAMKRLFFIFSVLVVLSSLSIACTKETELVDDYSVNNPDAVFSFAISKHQDTKALIGSDASGRYLEWESTDKLGVLVNSTFQESAITLGNPVKFSVTGTLAVNDNLYAWHSYFIGETDPSEVWLYIPKKQSQPATGFDFDAMPVVSKPITVTSSMLTAYSSDPTAPLAEINFANIGSLINFKIFSTSGEYSGEKVYSVSFEADDYLAGTFEFDLTGVDFTDDETLEIDSFLSDATIDGNIAEDADDFKKSMSITTSIPSGASIGTDKASALDVYMVVAPGSYSGNVIVETNKARYSYPISSPRDFARAGVKAFGLDLAKDGARGPLQMYLLKTDFPTSYGDGSFTKTVAGKNYTIEFEQCGNYGNLQLKKNDGIIKNTTGIGKITSIVCPELANTAAVSFGTSTSSYTAGNKSSSTFTPVSGTNPYFKIEPGTAEKYLKAGDIVISFYPFEDSGLAWSKATGAATIKDGDVISTDYPTIVNPHGVTVASYGSSDETVATIASNGVITILKAGTTTISATFNGDETYAGITVSYTLTVTDNTVYSVIIAPGILNGTITASPTSAKAGVDITLTITPDSGCALASLSVVDGSSNTVDVDGDNKFVMPASNVTVNATFAVKHSITIASYSNGTVSTSPEDEAAVGAAVTITATADTGYEIKSTTVTGDTSGEEITVSAGVFTMPDENVTVTVVFGKKKVTKWVKITKASDIEVGGLYVLASKNSTTYSYLPNTASTSSNPALNISKSSTLSGSEIADANVTSDMKWKFTDAGSSKIYIESNASSTNKLNTTSSTGTNLRVSSGNTDRNKWTITENASHGWDFYNTAMYLAVYSTTAWRNYANNTTNQNGTFIIFKRVEVEE